MICNLHGSLMKSVQNLGYLKKQSLSERMKLKTVESSLAAVSPISNVLNRKQAAVARGKSTL